MKRNALLIGLLAAACGGKAAPQNDTLGTSNVQPKPTQPVTGAPTSSTTPAPVDAATAFRLAHSNEGGMWMPMQMNLPGHVELFKKMGVKMDASVLADPLAAPLNAIVSLGGCSASFVSPDGLIVTNHHCVQGALQHNSTPENNLVENGFLAKTRADEVSAGPAQRVFVAQAFKDVTKEMRDGLDKIKDPAKRKEESEKRLKQLTAACEKDRPELRCDIKSFFRGGQYIQIENLEIKDVRLVYVPPRSVGNYGGEIDNWAWPRHTGDFSFYRAYVGKDGKPADFSKDNVPFKPKHFLKVSSSGVKPGDFVMVTGYPGSTSRTETVLETQHDIEWYYPYLIAYYKERYAIAEANLKSPGETAIKAAVMKQGIQNGLEKFQGVLDGLKKNEELMARKRNLDKQVKEWAAKPGNEAHKAAIEKLEAMILEEQRTARVDFDRNMAFGGSKLLSQALSFNRWSEERVKKDADRKPGFQDRDMPRAVAGQKSFGKAYDRTLDRAGFRLALTRALQLDEKERPWLATLLGVKKGTKIDEALIDKTLDSWYAGATLEDEKVRMELLQKGDAKKMKASKDPFVQAALRIWPLVKADEKKHDAIYGEWLLYSPSYAEGMKQVLGGLLAPDANSTLRVTYGTVKSFKPGSNAEADWPFTTASQILAKNTGKEPFDAPAKLVEAVKAKKYGPYVDAALGGELPVDFLSDLDITGGNSGSATLNDKGELVGLAFDGTTEGLASDVVFNGATTRVIHVDARYMLWNMDLLDGADHLLKEMGITPAL
ncbi:MAG: S46 family peptidase [Kofleriaceae bacterium]|nr:S46 family peptidase [Kofleriaceae bacterium]